MIRYYEEDIFKRNTFHEITIQEFDMLVVEHRNQFEDHYTEYGKEYIDKNTGLKYRQIRER